MYGLILVCVALILSIGFYIAILEILIKPLINKTNSTLEQLFSSLVKYEPGWCISKHDDRFVIKQPTEFIPDSNSNETYNYIVITPATKKWPNDFNDDYYVNKDLVPECLDITINNGYEIFTDHFVPPRLKAVLTSIYTLKKDHIHDPLRIKNI
jgi:hypothetical protein